MAILVNSRAKRALCNCPRHLGFTALGLSLAGPRVSRESSRAFSIACDSQTVLFGLEWAAKSLVSGGREGDIRVVVFVSAVVFFADFNFEAGCFVYG